MNYASTAEMWPSHPHIYQKQRFLSAYRSTSKVSVSWRNPCFRWFMKALMWVSRKRLEAPNHFPPQGYSQSGEFPRLSASTENWILHSPSLHFCDTINDEVLPPFRWKYGYAVKDAPKGIEKLPNHWRLEKWLYQRQDVPVPRRRCAGWSRTGSAHWRCWCRAAQKSSS